MAVTLCVFEHASHVGVSETVTALSDLLNSGSLSARQAADRAASTGVNLPYGTIASYWAGRHGKPSPATITKLAAVVEFTEAQLQQAAWGVTAPLGPWTPPPESQLMSDRQRNAVTELIRSFVQPATSSDQSESATAAAAAITTAGVAKLKVNRGIDGTKKAR